MNREQRQRAWPANKPTYAELESLCQDMLEFIKVQAGALKAAEKGGRVEMIFADEVNGTPIQGPMVSLDTYDTVTKKQAALITWQRDLLFAMGDLRQTIEAVDRIALHGTKTDMAKNLEGLDKQLATVFTAFKGIARQQDFKMGMYAPHLEGWINDRIEGIQIAAKDGGDYLRDKVRQSRQDLVDLIDRISEKAVQGRIADPMTERRHEHGQLYKYDGGRTWEDTDSHVLQFLRGRRHKLDALDREILAELEYREANGSLGTYIKDGYHSHENHKRP